MSRLANRIILCAALMTMIIMAPARAQETAQESMQQSMQERAPTQAPAAPAPVEAAPVEAAPVAAAASAQSNLSETIVIKDAIARAHARDRGSINVFLTLENTGKTTDVLSGVSSPQAQTARLEVDMMEEDSIMTVITPSVSLSPGQSIKLEPLGTHIVLSGLRGPVTPGSQFEIELRFANSAARRIMVPYADSPQQEAPQQDIPPESSPAP